MTGGGERAPRIAVAGSVSFSRETLHALLRHGANVVAVLGLDAAKSDGVSDYARLDDLAALAGADYRDFKSINEPALVEWLSERSPDIFFVVGLSQLVRAELMAVPRLGAVGFHPTWLPKGRGRAPVAWLTHDATPGAASFFVIVEEADAGPLFVQEPFFVQEDAYAEEVIAAVRAAIGRALDRWLPRLLDGEWNPDPQEDAAASFYGRRSAEDGLIEWSAAAVEIHRLIRTASRPYPGAYTFAAGAKVVVWRAELEKELPFRGVVGRILNIDGRGVLVQTGAGLIRLTETEIEAGADGSVPKLRIGMKLGFSAQDELYQLRKRVAALESELLRLHAARDSG